LAVAQDRHLDVAAAGSEATHNVVQGAEALNRGPYPAALYVKNDISAEEPFSASNLGLNSAGHQPHLFGQRVRSHFLNRQPGLPGYIQGVSQFAADQGDVEADPD
jgi:hypothetical protein